MEKVVYAVSLIGDDGEVGLVKSFDPSGFMLFKWNGFNCMNFELWDIPFLAFDSEEIACAFAVVIENYTNDISLEDIDVVKIFIGG